MPESNTIISTSVRIAESTGHARDQAFKDGANVTVELDQGRRVYLEPNSPKSAVLEKILGNLAKIGHPVCLQVDPETSTVARIFIPHVARVTAIQPTEIGYGVALEGSPAPHFLKRDQPDFEEIAGRLDEARERGSAVILTENDAREVFDVRHAVSEPHRAPAPPEAPELDPRLDLDLRSRNFVVRMVQTIVWFFLGCSPAAARRAFDTLGALSCDPASPGAPCIPFLYPDTGCDERAHEMCRLMTAMRLRPEKVWLDGNMEPSTRYHEDCLVRWNYHVAPTIWVYLGFGVGSARMVIDPSVSAEPLDVNSWLIAQTTRFIMARSYSDAARLRIFRPGSPEVRDPTFVEHFAGLRILRMRLMVRAMEAPGGLPYRHCSP